MSQDTDTTGEQDQDPGVNFSETQLDIATALLLCHRTQSSSFRLPRHLDETIPGRVPNSERTDLVEPSIQQVAEAIFQEPFGSSELPTKAELLNQLNRQVTHPRNLWTQAEGLKMIEDQAKWHRLLKDMTSKATRDREFILSPSAGHRDRLGEERLTENYQLAPLAQLLDPALHRE